MSKKYYMEVRGSMTRFEPLTNDILHTLGPNAPTYSELKDALAAHGLSSKYVVCDSTRAFQCFYGDSTQGL